MDKVLDGRLSLLANCVRMKGPYVDAKTEIEQQPNDYDGRKGTPDLRRAQRLNQEKADQNGASRADNGS